MALSLGPDTTNPIQDRGSLVKISLPYDLRPMGINHTLESKTLFERGMYLKIKEIPTVDCVFKVNRVLVIYPDGKSVTKLRIEGAPASPFNKTITINGELYDNGTRLGEGISGIVYSFTHARTGEIICVKFQNLEDIHSQMMFIKEGIIHHILYESTKYDTHEDCQYVPEFRKIYRTKLIVNDIQNGSSRLEDFGIYIIGLCDGTYDSLIDKTMTDTSTPIIQLARKLDRLYELYKFNHCDFHAQNCMYVKDPTTKPIFLLNDFGYSQIELDTDTGRKFPIVVRDFGPREERDLTHLVTYLEAKKAPYKVGGNMYDFGQRIVDDTLYTKFKDESFYSPWHAVYDWMDDPDNKNSNAIPIVVLRRENNVAPYITGSAICNPPKISWSSRPALPPPPPNPPEDTTLYRYAGVTGDAIGGIVGDVIRGGDVMAREAINLMRTNPVGGTIAVAACAAVALYDFYKLIRPGAGGFIKSVRNKKHHSTRRRPKKLIRVKSVKHTRRHGKSKRSAHRK